MTPKPLPPLSRSVFQKGLRLIHRIRPSRETVLRVAADTLLLNVAVLMSIAARFIYLSAYGGAGGGGGNREILSNFLIGYRNSAWLLTLICLVVFTLSGFYSEGRAYQGRYKALIVAQGVSLGYSLFGFLSYFMDGVGLGRGTFIYAWVLSVAMLVVARVWATIWSGVVRAEFHKRKQPNSQKIRNVLVIGGAGYIGSALLPKLLGKGYNVRLLDLFLYGYDAIDDILDHPKLETLRADFRQIDKVVEAMRGMDAVIHLGAIVGDPACALDEEITLEVNLMATRMIAEVAKGSGVSRFIFASTCSVYGASDDVLDERSTLNPESLYARSKVASERVLMSMADSSFAPTLLRFGTIYGLSGRTRFDLVINLLAAKALVDGKITVFGGDQWRPFLHVHDAAKAVFETLEAPLQRIRNQVFNVGSNEQNYTISQVGELIHDLIPTAQLLDVGADGDRRNYRVCFDKVSNALNFVPEWTVEQGVHQVIEAIESGKILDYRDPKFSNVKFLSDEAAYRLTPQNGWARELIKESSLAARSEEPPRPLAATGD